MAASTPRRLPALLGEQPLFARLVRVTSLPLDLSMLLGERGAALQRLGGALSE